MEECVDVKGFPVKHWALSFPYIQGILSNDWAIKAAQVKEKEKSPHEYSCRNHVAFICRKRVFGWGNCRVMADDELFGSRGAFILTICVPPTGRKLVSKTPFCPTFLFQDAILRDEIANEQREG